MKSIALYLGPVLAIIAGSCLSYNDFSSSMTWTVSITLLVAIYWIFEPIPIPATSLVPLTVFPLTGVLSEADVAAAFGHKLILLMMGGFMLSAAMEKSGAHRRIAVGMVNFFGNSNGRRIVFGFMAAAAFLSMWISNAATTLMLLPIAMAVVSQTDDRKLQIGMLLGIAYAGSIGGIGTPIGTPPNLIFISVLAEHEGAELSFVRWMMYALPIVLVMLPLAGFWLTRGLNHVKAVELPEVGGWRREEVLTLIVFAITALMWITRQQPFGGWRGLLNLQNASDAHIALLSALSLFVISNGKGGKLLDWDSAKSIPWGILILFAGGICIAKAFGSSGLSEQLGNLLAGLKALPVILLMLALCLGVTFLTEITSNTATTTLLMPILLAAAIAAEMDPRIFMIPATISASFAFMLPVATPPNAIVFGSQKLTIKEMANEGFVLNILGAVVICILCYLMFG